MRKLLLCLSYFIPCLLAVALAASGSSPQPSSDHEITAELRADSVSASTVESKKASAERGPKWHLNEIRVVRMDELPPKRITPLEEKAANSPQDETDEEYAERIARVRRERNKKIVTLATTAIGGTQDDPSQEEQFTAAVHELMEARLHLALTGQKEEIEGLYKDAATIEATKPKSRAAAEAALLRARFAHMNAQLFGEQEPRWLEEFAKQARYFAKQYPDESARGSMLLHAAGWSCELHRQHEEAIACYSSLTTQFASAPMAPQAAAAIRRLKLKGQKVELSGPTSDGGFVRNDDFAGKTVLVVFWASDSGEFVERQLPRIQAVAEKYGNLGLAVVGVNLDEEEGDLREFMEEHKLTWPQIFHSDVQHRRWNSPLVEYYGVRDIPQIWLISRDGIVIDTNVDSAMLDREVSATLDRSSPDGAE